MTQMARLGLHLGARLAPFTLYLEVLRQPYALCSSF